MPIKPENKDLYPENWPEIVRRIRTRAGNRCEDCGVANHLIGMRLKDGTVRRLTPVEWDCIYSRIKNQHSNMTESLKHFGFIKIVCTVSHNDHNPSNCSDDNLRFRCQRCHNRYDRKHRNETIRRNKLKGQLQFNLI